MPNNDQLPSGRDLARSHLSRSAAINELMEYRNPTVPAKLVKEFIGERVKYEIETIWKKPLRKARAL